MSVTSAPFCPHETASVPASSRWPERLPRMATETDCQTLASTLDDLARRGFTESLAVVGNELRTTKMQKIFRPDEVVIREYRRFEGVSDPDDMSIVYAIETEGGIRGTLVDAYGVYADPAVSAFLSKEIGRAACRKE